MCVIPRSLIIAVCVILTTSTWAQLSPSSDCGSSVGCFSYCPDGDSNCKSNIEWRKQSDRVDFVFQVNTGGSSNYWVALGLSNDKQMGSDSVTDCIMNGGSDQIEVRKSYNSDTGKSNSAITTSGILNSTMMSYANGILTCMFSQTLTNEDAQIYDLNTARYLLVAYGVASGSKIRHAISGGDIPKISDTTVNFADNIKVGAAVEKLVKVHGSLMIFGWMFCASIGIVLARFFKPMYPRQTMLNEKVWFTLHRLLMITCFLAVLVAFLIILVDVGGWSNLDGHSKWQKVHPYLGVVITGCVILNPIMAMFRPHPDASTRFVFNLLHWFVGTSAHVLSAIAIALGVTLGKSSVPFYVVWIVVAWAGYQAVFVLFLEMHECAIASAASKYDKDGQEVDPPGSALKTGSLLLHVLIITGLTVTCIVLVAIN